MDKPQRHGRTRHLLVDPMGFLLAWGIVHGRLGVRPVRRSDDHAGGGVLPRRRVVEHPFVWMTHGHR